MTVHGDRGNGSDDMRTRTPVDAALLEGILESTLAGYWDWNLRDGTEYLSPTFKRMFGYEDHELPNSPETWQRLIFPEDLPGVLEVFDRHVESRGEVPYLNDVRYRHKDGSTVWVRCAGRVVEWAEDGSPVRMAGCHIDITDRRRAEEALRESEARFRDVALSSAGILWEADARFVATHVSGRHREILGYEAEEILGRDPLFLIEETDRPCVAALMARLVESREPARDLESWCRAKDGRRVRIANYGIPFHAPDGRFLGYRGTHLDVTERYWARQRRELLLRIHALGGANAEAVSALLCEACAHHTDSSMAFFGMVEEDGSAMIAHVWSPEAMADCRVPERPQRFPIATAGIWAEPIRRREPTLVNDYASAGGRKGLPEGHVPILRYLGVPIVGEGRVIAVAGVANKEAPYDDLDIERLTLLTATVADYLCAHRAERALRESERRLRTFIDFTSDWEYWRLPDGRHLYDSPACERITGYPAAEFEADPGLAARIVHPEDRARFDEHAPQAAAGSCGDTELEFRIVRKDGGIRWIQHRCGPVLDGQGRFTGTRVSNRDVTDRKEAEAERERLRGELVQSQKLESIGRLAGGVAHDFNNMLGVIIGHTEFCLEQVSPGDPVHEDLRVILETANRSATITRQLLGFARKQSYAPVPLDLDEAVAGMLPMLRRQVGEDVSIAWRPGGNGERVKMDPAQLTQILTNLCANARDAIAGMGRIAIETGFGPLDEALHLRAAGRASADHVLLSVSDDGAGMDEETSAHLFEPFFTTKAPGRGTGLGLATVYGIVKQNGGFIGVTTAPGRGTTFRIFLPCHEGADHAAAQVCAAAPSSGRETVLLCEDEPALLELTRRALAQFGYRTLAAATPGEALHLAEAHPGPIDLLLTDVIMPEMNGRDLARNVLKIHPGMACLFMSGHTADVIAHRGVLSPGVNFLRKPFARTELAAKLREALGGRG